ncbi:MAG: ankyrin repeat domain-containing protein [Acidobacteria bacterium]|nr:ankyrin repeat domain-containing protein [Acidobacteriota bacterium]
MTHRDLAGRLASAGVVVLATAAVLLAAPSATPVADAARAGDVDAVRALLQQGTDVNGAHGDGMSALHWAAQRGDRQMAEILVYAGAKVTAVTRIGQYTPLHVASTAGNAALIELLLESGSDVAAPTTPSGVTPLHLAAASGSGEAVATLIDHGADVDALESAWGQTPLLFAAARDRVDVIRTLLEHGADPAITSKTVDLVTEGQLVGAARERQRRVLTAFETDLANGATPTASQVQAAVLAGRARYLSGEVPEREEDADARPPTIKTKGGLTALLHAVRQGHIGAATALLDGGTDIDQVSAGDATSPLLMATINAQFDLAMLLIERGADPNLAATINGVAPLWATINAEWQPRTRFPQPQQHELQAATYLDVMAALLDAGADPDVRLTRHPWYMVYSGCGNRNCGLVDTEGSTAFWRAAYATDLPALRLLVAHGADSDIPTEAPPPRRARRGTTAENDDESDVPAVLPAAPGFWVATDLTTMGPDPSGLPPFKAGDPGVYPIHAASGVGYGEGFAGNAHRHAPDAWLATVRYLIELGADVNQRDHNGYNAIHHAAARGDDDLILYLLEQGGDVTAVSRRGQTTADMANGPVQRVSPMPETVALLESLGSTNNHNCVSC